MSIHETFQERSPDTDFYDMLRFRANSEGTIAQELTSWFIEEGIDGMKKLRWKILRERDRPTELLVLNKYTFRQFPQHEDELKLEVGAIVLATRLQHMFKAGIERQFAYRGFIADLQSSVEQAEWQVAWDDPYPDLEVIDLGAALHREVDRQRIAGVLRFNIQNMLHQNDEHGKLIRRKFSEQRTWLPVAEDNDITPLPVREFLSANRLLTTERVALPEFTRYIQMADLWCPD